jgi:hypothetical protein
MVDVRAFAEIMQETAHASAPPRAEGLTRNEVMLRVNADNRREWRPIFVHVTPGRVEPEPAIEVQDRSLSRRCIGDTEPQR